MDPDIMANRMVSALGTYARRALTAALALALLALPAIAGSEWGERPGIHFSDMARVVKAGDVNALEEEISQVERALRADVRVGFFPSLNGRDAANVGYEVIRDWDMGRGYGEGHYILLLIFTRDRKLRLEYGSAFDDTDLRKYAENIVQAVMVPRMKKKKYVLGTTEGLIAVQRAVEGKYNPIQPPKSFWERYQFIIWLLVIVLMPGFGFGYGYWYPWWFGFMLGGWRGDYYLGGGSSSFGGSGFGGGFGGGGFSGGGGGVTGSW